MHFNVSWCSLRIPHVAMFSFYKQKTMSLQHQFKAKLNKNYTVSCSFLTDIFLIHILGI